MTESAKVGGIEIWPAEEKARDPWAGPTRRKPIVGRRPEQARRARDGWGGGESTSDLPRFAWHPVFTLMQWDFYQVWIKQKYELWRRKKCNFSSGMKAATGPMDTTLILRFFSQSSSACLVLTGSNSHFSLHSPWFCQIFCQVLPGLPCYRSAQILNFGLLLHWTLGLSTLPYDHYP